MHIAVTMRRVVARHPWVYWLTCLVLALAVAALVNRQVSALDATRREWGTTRRVLVAVADHQPGEPLRAEPRPMPIALVPEGAVLDADAGAHLDEIVRQRVTSGEVVVSADLAPPNGPAALAAHGTMVVGIVDLLARDVRIGLAVQIVAEGVVLADDARIVAVADDVVFVAVQARTAPMVAAAAHDATASLVFVP
jgi:hypothetical protein